MIKARRDKDKGFTLVELLVVIIIIGILAAVAVPAFLNQRQRANEAALKSDIKTVALAMETWIAMPGNSDATILTSLPNQSGWSLIFRGSPEAKFGIGGATGTTEDSELPVGFDHVNITKGNAVGVLARNWSGVGMDPGTYCITGNADNSKYAVPATPVVGRSEFSYAMFYDSAMGGFYTAENLPAGGACNAYRNAINSGL